MRTHEKDYNIRFEVGVIPIRSGEDEKLSSATSGKGNPCGRDCTRNQLGNRMEALGPDRRLCPGSNKKGEDTGIKKNTTKRMFAA